MIIPADAATQHGCFLYRQAYAVGWTYDLLESAVLRKHLVVVRRGVWMERALWLALDDRGRHVARLHADLLVAGPHWFAARRSVAAMLDLPTIGRLAAESQLLADPGPSRRKAPSRHRQVAPLLASDTYVHDGIRSVCPYRAVVDMARQEPFLNAVVVADALLGMGQDEASLRSTLADMKGWPGAEAAEAAIDFADGRSESALESLSRVRCHHHQLPPPELQLEIWLGDEYLGRADKVWREFNVIGEDDGLFKFGATNAEREESFKVMYARSRRREDVGFAVPRWDWDDAWKNNGAVLIDRLRGAFAAGAAKTLDPRVRFVPTTVADRLRRDRRRTG